jgi:cellulase (glycosyl hydrolase family 5)
VPSRVLIFALLLATFAFPGAAQAARGVLTGFLDPQASSTERQDLILTADDALTRSKDAGASIIRFYLYWNRVTTAQPADPEDPADPAYDWSLVDEQVNTAIAHGLEPMLDFRSAPLWAQGAEANERGTFSPDPVGLAAFARAAAAHYSGLVHYWEIWNEPNSPEFLLPQRDADGRSIAPTLYRQLVNAAADALHEADANNVVVIGETSPRASGSGHAPLAFLRRVFAAPVEADVVSHHPYSLGSPERHASGPNDVYVADLPKWGSVVRAAVSNGMIVSHDGTPKTHVRLWVSEISWDSNPPDPAGVPVSLHARWTAEALYRTWQAGATVFIWQQLHDYPLAFTTRWDLYQGGLYTSDLAPKLSLRAFRFPFVAYAGNGRISVWGRTPPAASGQVVVERHTPSGWKPVRRWTVGATGIFRGRWTSSRTRGYYRARIGVFTSVAFSLRRPAELVVSPFGCGGFTAC